MTGAIALALFVTAALPASSQDRDAPARKSGNGVLRGRVIAVDTGRPVAHAKITAASAQAGSRPTAPTSTDVSGAFQLSGLAEGDYILVASKPGAFLDTQYGQTHPDLPGKVVSIRNEGETTIEIAMIRPGVISGRIVDETGDPVPNAAITAIRQQTSPDDGHADSTLLSRSTGFRTVGGTTIRFNTGDGRSISNDRGEYRLFGLAPGRYLVTAMVPNNGGTTRRTAPVYFPGVTDPAAAMRLEIAAGQEIANADFIVRFAPVSTITGMAVGPDDQPLASGSVSLYLSGVDGLAGISQIATIKRDGTFKLEAVAGEYTLRARHQLRGAPGSSPYASDLSLAVPITVRESDIPGIFLKLTYGATLKGRMLFEGPVSPPRAEAGFRVGVESGAPGAAIVGRRSEDDTFVLSGIEAGTRRLTTKAPAEWILKAIYLNGQNVSELPIEFSDGMTQENVTVVFTTVKSPLSIAVEHASPEASATVAVFPRDPATWHAASRRIQFRTAGAKAITVDMLPPGDYLVAAIADVAARSLRPGDIKLLERLSPFAEHVRIVEGTTMSVRVRPVSLPR